MSKDTPAEVVQSFGRDVKRVKEEIGKMIVGQDDIVDGVLTCLLAGGQALLEGVPGLGKTMLVRTLAESMRLEFSRIQFTPDLMPADILGTTVLSEDAHGKQKLEFRKGPIFSNIVLADEVNRATPKTQSALLEVMQEHSVTIGGKTYPMDQPYFVLATQNPLEMEGTYPLPEAQLDRFLFKLQVEFPSREELHAILDRTTGAETPWSSRCWTRRPSSRCARWCVTWPSPGTCRTTPSACWRPRTPAALAHRTA
jgi:MoxR-like ATPase